MIYSVLESFPARHHLYLDCDKALYYVYNTVKKQKSLGCYTRPELCQAVVDKKNKEYLEVCFKAIPDSPINVESVESVEIPEIKDTEEQA